MADAEVSKTSLFGGVGSSPTSGTTCGNPFKTRFPE